MAPDLNSVPASPHPAANGSDSLPIDPTNGIIPTDNLSAAATDLSPAAPTYTSEFAPAAAHTMPTIASAPVAAAPINAPKPQPNILYIMADQLAAPLLKMYNAQSQIKTPNLDKLAENGVVFSNAYCPSPLCAPSRMSMVTSQLPTKIGAYDNANSIGSDVPTYAHYLRSLNYETVLAGKMHFIGEQLHGYERRLTSDIYPGDYGWVVNWDEPGRRLEWYHNASSILQAGTCVRSNQLDYDEEVMYKSRQFLFDHVRKGERRPFALTVSLTHPHDPYCIEQKYWDMYEDTEISLPTTSIPQDEQDSHSERLLKVCDLWDLDLSEEQVKRARRAYYGAVSYVDDCIGRLLQTLKDCRLDENTIIVFSGDHGDMLGERGLWYKMSYFESSVRVPLLVHHPKSFAPREVSANVSTLDILPTLVDLAGGQVSQEGGLEIDGSSLYPFLQGEDENAAQDTVYAEYCGEGTIAPLVMIKRGPWKYISCPADPEQLYNLSTDPHELTNLASPSATSDPKTLALLTAFRAETQAKWDFEQITKDVKKSQRQRRLVWNALKQGKWTSWDYNPAEHEDGRERYIRSHLPLDDLELMARFPRVDGLGALAAPESFVKAAAGAGGV